MGLINARKMEHKKINFYFFSYPQTLRNRLSHFPLLQLHQQQKSKKINLPCSHGRYCPELITHEGYERVVGRDG
jgi:hypothetical protein